MKKIIYTRSEDNGLNVVIPATKESIEEKLGILTDEEFREFVWKVSIPEGAINPRYIEDNHIPSFFEFRDAWCDVTSEEHIDIDLEKARDIQLALLRKDRQLAFENLGVPNKLHKEIEETILSPETRLELQRLRDITEPLKSLDVKGKFNDENLLNEIIKLGTL